MQLSLGIRHFQAISQALLGLGLGTLIGSVQSCEFHHWINFRIPSKNMTKEISRALQGGVDLFENAAFIGAIQFFQLRSLLNYFQFNFDSK